MAIKPFKRVENYFSGFKKIKADSIDSQFNIISDYLNKQILPTLNTLSSDKIPGSTNPADANKFLQNLGDGSTAWRNITEDSFAINSISLNKLVKTNAGSVMATNKFNQLVGINPTENGQILTSKLNELPIWKKITGDNIEDRAITGDKVADRTITNKNLPSYLIETLIADNTITGDKLKDSSITTNKFTNNMLTFEKLSSSLKEEFATGVWEHIIPGNHIKNVNTIGYNDPGRYQPNFQDQIVRIMQDNNQPTIKSNDTNNISGLTISTKIPASKFSVRDYPRGDDLYQNFSAFHLYGKIHCATKLKENSIHAIRVLVNYTSQEGYYFPRDLSDFLADKSVGLEHLSPQIRHKMNNIRGIGTTYYD